MTSERAQSAETAAVSATCPRCQGVAPLLAPLKNMPRASAAYGCAACGFAFTAEGRAVVEDLSHVRDVFRGGSLGHQTLSDMMKGEQMNPATRAFFHAQLAEYGLQMWMDGLKQGLLLGALDAAKKG